MRLGISYYCNLSRSDILVGGYRVGVIYKLKPDVVEAIIRHKCQNPQASCRELAEIVGKEFNTAVSKSSVNSVLKKFKLSSGIGRRTRRQKQEDSKFQIPSHTKERLASNVEQSGLVTIIPGASSASGPFSFKDTLPNGGSSLEESTPALSKILKVEEKINGTASSQVSQTCVGGASLESNVSARVGLIFLKAIDWDMGAYQGMKEIADKSYPQEDMIDFDQWWTFLVFWVYLMEHGDKNAQNEAKYPVWTFQERENVCSVAQLLARLDNFKSATVIREAWNQHKAHLFAQADRLELVTESQGIIGIDSSLRGVGPYHGNSVIKTSLSRALDNLSRHILSNKRCPIFLTDYGQEGFSPDTHVLMRAFANLSGYTIKAARVFNDDKLLAEFDIIPEHKRSWMMAVWPWQSAWAQIEYDKKIPLVEPVFVEHLEQHFMVAVGDAVITSSQRARVRGVRVWQGAEAQSDLSPAVIILTNEHKSGKAVCQDFMKRWPYFLEGSSEHEQREAQQVPQESICEDKFEASEGLEAVAREYGAMLMDGLTDVLDSVKNKLQHVGIIDNTRFIEEALSLPGHLGVNAGMYVVTLFLSENFTYPAILQALVEHLNQREIYNQQGQRLRLKIEKRASNQEMAKKERA